MESTRIMDRLICGDVGFGKTEVALRAAFKAVQDNKQVVYLCPTTILAKQIFTNFDSRMKDFGVEVRMLSRFCTPKEAKNTIEGLKKGLWTLSSVLIRFYPRMLVLRISDCLS